MTKYSCTSLSEDGYEYAYQFTATETGPVTVTLTGLDADLDLFVLLRPYGTCVPGNCIGKSVNVGDESVTFQALAGQQYHIVVDGFNSDDIGSFTIGLTCD